MRTILTFLVLAAMAVGLWWGSMRGENASHLLISDAVAKPLNEHDAAILLKIKNLGGPDRLLGASSGAGAVSLYSPVETAGLPIPTGSAALALDGANIRMSGIGASLTDGSLIPVELTFEKAGTITVKARLSDPAKEGQAGEVGLFGLGEICSVGKGEPAPKISLSVVPDGDGWAVHVNARDFEFSKDLAGMQHVPGMGHGHIYVGGVKLGRVYQPDVRIGALPKGTHEVRVTLNTNDHRAYVVGEEPVTASIAIKVD
ncbi:hypothetical protein NUH88_18170 [Nisaea acidiphila]|uniref:Copper chaperone PCu(A)C n=1 Tax=Nisaea acidiphila TaxID=1862145 RepID=A0A9J7AR06_9PROT|nr:copper chaperone PCu(A)C [Nisaea acidiphila]UUX49314.1 hypothetical protein NUH88_18170 [Nisaea acidiphila]